MTGPEPQRALEPWNLRKDHYRETGSNRPQLFIRVYIPMLLWRASGLFRGVHAPSPAKGPYKTCYQCRPSKHIIIKTFNNGSLGSGIDEERSEMR